MWRRILWRAGATFHVNGGHTLALALSYTSLLSFVPLIASITLLSATLSSDLSEGVYRLIPILIPGASRDLVEALEKAALNARALSLVAAAAFLVTSLRTFASIESATNLLWGSVLRRRFLPWLAMAAAVILVGPVAAGVGTSLFLQSGVKLLDFRISGFLVTAALLTTLYKYIPCAYVRWSAAATAGIFSAAGLGLIKLVFTLGVVFLTGVNVIYGSISAIVIFVFAQGFVWDVLLFGVALAHAVQFRDEVLLAPMAEPRTKGRGPLDDAVAMLLALEQARENGDPDVPRARLPELTGVPEERGERQLLLLAREGLVALDAQSARLSRDAGEISLWAVGRALGVVTEPVPIPAESNAAEVLLRRIYGRAGREVRSVLQGTSLKDLHLPQTDD
ncbi:MAG: YihY/virulence factor BrkB family protein [Acidobacteria bacterium]|nr:YihY/virulence factor BrkB family protein [Acidobacteriota bacterium]